MTVGKYIVICLHDFFSVSGINSIDIYRYMIKILLLLFLSLLLCSLLILLDHYPEAVAVKWGRTVNLRTH